MPPHDPYRPTPADEIFTSPGSWEGRAACRGIESSVFFSPDGERGHARARRESGARQICQDCPVLAQCRDHALSNDEPYGIWGGMTEADRRRHTRRLRRGEAPPHTPVHSSPSADPRHATSASR
ncbi:Transcription factor WhiB [Rhodococcus jostii]|uniref:Transcriptional regulator WhiB n=1 Tax=Rhodococcus jostii TaxID=132919 RepID=A0A1H5M9E7_RHOJO|nr:Transcription factor WhiB [Rhodococcus jostii]